MKPPFTNGVTPKPVRFGRALLDFSRVLSDLLIWQRMEVRAYRLAIQAGLKQWRINTRENADVFVRGHYMFLTFPHCLNFILEFDACRRLPYPPATFKVLEARMAALRLLYCWMHYQGIRVFGWRVYTLDPVYEKGVPALCINPAGFRFCAPDLRFEAREGTYSRKLDDLRLWSLGPSATMWKDYSCNGYSKANSFTWP